MTVTEASFEKEANNNIPPGGPLALTQRPFLSPDIACLIAEHCDSVKTVSSLIKTCHSMHQLLNDYERSISRSMINMRQHTHELPSSGTILSSFDQERVLLGPADYDTVQELDMRARRIDALFDSDGPVVSMLVENQSFNSLPADQITGLINGMKRAAMLTDRLSDCVAEEMTKSRESSTTGCDETDAINRRAHRARLDFITALPALDLSYLATLVDFAAMMYVRVHPFGDGDPSPWPRHSAFREALLRQGSLVLWAWMKPPGYTAEGNKTTSTTPTASVTTQTAATTTSGSSGQIPANGPNSASPDVSDPFSNNGITPLARYVEGVIDGIIDEIEKWESGYGASFDSEFDDEDLILPGLYRRIQVVFSEQTKWPVERAGKEMELMVLLELRKQ